MLNLDLRLLEKFYLNKGFYNVQIKNSSAIFNNNYFNLVYNIDAGNIYTINETKLILPDDFDKKDFKDVEKILSKLKGEKYSFNKLNKVVKQIDKISVSRLYDFIDASIETQIVNDNKLDIKFVVNESENIKTVNKDNKALILKYFIIPPKKLNMYPAYLNLNLKEITKKQINSFIFIIFVE